MTGVSEPVDPADPDPAGRLTDAQRRELTAVGAVLVAIEDGLGLQAALDPAFDVDAALAMVETMLGAQLARFKSAYDPEAPATRKMVRRPRPVTTCR